MKEQICIYDVNGNRICYSNHALRGKATLPYQLWYTRKSGKAVPLGNGWLRRGAPSLEKLQVVIAAALAFGWRDWAFITHERHARKATKRVRAKKRR